MALMQTLSIGGLLLIVGGEKLTSAKECVFKARVLTGPPTSGFMVGVASWI